MQPVIESLTLAEKRSLLASLLNRDRLQTQLSLTQERLWQLCQLQQDTPLYNFQTSLELHGDLFPGVLEIAALKVVQRHRVLQTGYGMEQGRPALHPSPLKSINIVLHELSHLSHEEREQRMEALGMEDAQRPFDLAQPPLFRLTLTRLAPGKHRLYLTMHHIVSDFLSLDLFLLELGAFYSAELTGQPHNLPLLTAGYQDFARMQHHPGTSALDDAHLEYWRRTLADAKPIEWFSDHVRPATPTGRAGTEFFNIPSGLMSQIETFARAEQATPFMVLLAGFNILLQACSGQSDLVVGCPMAGRIRSEYESLVGMFSYPVLMRTKMAGCHDVRGLLQRVRKVVLEAAEHGDVPFAKVTDCLGSQPASLVRAMFSYVSRLRNLRFEGLQCSRRPTDRGVTDLDLFMTIYPDRDEWHGVLEYNTDLFEAPTIRSLVAAYIDVLQAALAEPDLSVVGLATRARVKPPARLTVAATFTADPLLEVLSFWSAELDIPLTPVIAPYNQLFQQLMDPQSQVLSPGGALNVLLVRPEDWVRCVGSDLDKQTRLLARSTLDFIAAVHNATPRMSCPLKIYLCPPSPGLATDIALAVAAAEQEIREAFAPIDTIQILSAEVCAEMYSAAEIHDRQADRAAHIPYTLEFYAAVGTQIIRQLRMQTSRSSKVLVLDCDNTLWQGLCAENGPHGVVITEGHRALQRFVLQQAATGVLICLASKNVPEEVFQVFRTNPAMILQESDITAFRINWEPKSSNLVSLAAELRLALDSFVFLDDDPRECAEVSARCPQVLSLRLPQEPAGLLHFTRHLWIFDRDGLSDEDRRRTGFYHDQQRRKLALQHAPSLGEFLATLELRVDARPAPPGQIARIAQLSQRTNQFTATGVAVNQFDLQTAVRQGREVMAVEVSDRFGEYGMAGAVLYKKDTEALTVEAFYLSCRVLGRGVEHRILSELGCIAHRAGLEHIRIQWEESSRNQAFRRFLGQLPGRVEKPVGRPWTFILTTQQALEAKLIPADDAPSTAADPGSIHPNREVAVRSLAALARLPHELSSTGQILSRISLSASARREQRVSRVFTAPHDGLEGTIATEWCAILRLDRVGRNDNFFELGGNSLLLVQLNGNLISRLGLDITIPEMFEYPTVASLAIHLTGRTCADHSPETNSRAARSRAALQNRKRQLTVHRPQSQVNVGGGS